MPKKNPKENNLPSANTGEKIEPREITTELRESYLDYAMSVIVSRALPDVRDGLKPVHRRVLWAMWDMGLHASSKLMKSARVTGETMGKYHPHGNMAIYDSIVRMAQDFSLRYPLVHGQGNFGCFTKDTKVKLTDGRNLSFGELVKESQQGKKNYTYAINSIGLISVAEIKNPRLTKKDAELVKVFLDNNKFIRSTPDHLFMLKDGTYKKALDLKSGDRLMPLYEKLSAKEDRLNREGYVLLYQPKTDVWIPAHHLADNYNLTVGVYKKDAGRVRHHVDFNKLNNNPNNIRRLNWGEHWKIHYEQASLQHKNPAYREKISEGRKKIWANPENRRKNAERISERNRKNWQNPLYRENMRRFLSEINKIYNQEHPERRIEFSERATKTLKRLWSEPYYKNLFHEKIVASNKKRITNNTGKVKFLNVCRVALADYSVLNRKLYEETRNKIYGYGAATQWETGLKKYFNNNPELIFQEINKNHKVMKVEISPERENVYDLTIDRYHNFALEAGVFVHNSVDGDGAAAERYTEIKMAKIAEELLFDIEKETVDWQQNYDNSRLEPKFLPAKLPNLLLNGSMGIAVGMATSIPPHNLLEVADAISYLSENPGASVKDLMKFIPGPDFPTGGIIYDKSSIEAAYTTGKGGITIRAVADIEERKNHAYRQAGGSFQIVITELPYQVNKSELIVKIAELTQEKKIEGIRDIRDESDREGMRIVIELKQDSAPQKILNQLYKHTELQKNFYFNMLALVNGIQPQVLSLKDVLSAYLDHRKIIVRRRTEFDLKKAEERAHILEGLAKALDAIDAVIAIIKKSANRENAKENLIKKFKFTPVQADAILEMRLQTLAALEHQKIEDELKEKKKLIAELQLILKHPKKITEIITSEITELKKNYSGARKTKLISHGLKEFREEDLVPQEETLIILTRDGYIKRMAPDTFKSQKRGGKGLIGFELKEEDQIQQFISAMTHDNILFFTDRGRVFQTKIYEVPVATRTAKGKSIHTFLTVPQDEKINAVVSYPEETAESSYLVMATRNGIIKKTRVKNFGNVRRNGIIAINLKGEDILKWAKLSSGNDEIILVTDVGQAIRFKEKDIQPMGRTASGVKAIRLRKNNFVAGLDIISKGQIAKSKSDERLLTVMANGFAKQTPLKEYKIQKRGGSGIKTAKITAKTGLVIAINMVDESFEAVLAFSKKGQVIKTEIKNVRLAGRATQGVRIMNLNKDDELIGIVCL